MPASTPCRVIASRAYDEHVGKYRHEAGKKGETMIWYARIGSTAIARMNRRTDVMTTMYAREEAATSLDFSITKYYCRGVAR